MKRDEKRARIADAACGRQDEIAVCIDAHSATASTSQAVVDAPTGTLRR